MPLIDLGQPGGLRFVGVEDALAVVSQHDRYHLGLPEQDEVEVRTTARTLRILPLIGGLLPGDVYVASAADWADFLLVNGTGATGNVLKLVDALRKYAKAGTLFTPLGVPAVAWDVPQPEEPLVPRPAHTLCTWRGIFGPVASPVEHWSFSLKCLADPTAQPQPILDAAAAALSTAYSNNLKETLPPSIVLTETVYARIDGEGKVARFPDLTYQQGKNTAVVVGTGTGSAPLPLQTALVVTLDTTRPGPTGKGRIFLPYQGQVSPDFRVPVEVAQSAGTAVARLILDVNAILGDVCVVSTKGYATPVARVRVGRAPDTMRSRRADLEESYVIHALTP